MKKLFLILGIIVLIGVIALVALNMPKEKSLVVNNITPENEIEELGIIEGSLGYPSSGIPQMKICAVNINTQEEVCTTEHIEDEKYQYSKGYIIEVPPGEYNVYASLISSLGSLDPSYRAYYSEFVVCGLAIWCPSHEPIVVFVESGKKYSDIDPIDWYK